MSEPTRQAKSIVVKNLPPNFTEEELYELFCHYGAILSTKVLPPNASYPGGYGFVNFADPRSCDRAVGEMDHFIVHGFELLVNMAKPRPGNYNTERAPNEFRAVVDSNSRPTSRVNTHMDESNTTSSPGMSSRAQDFRPSSERAASSTQLRPIASMSSLSSTNEPDVVSNPSKSPLDAAAGQQTQDRIGKSPLTNGLADFYQSLNIREHAPLAPNQTYHVYLSSIEPPNVVFVATLDDYVSATLLIAQMNKHEQLTKVQANSYKSKLSVGQHCAALFKTDWYRARVLEVAENRVRVQYIDWGNTDWCDPVLQIRPLPNIYYKDPVLCVKCILDDVPSIEKLTTERKDGIVRVLILDVKLEMFVLRMENNLPCVRLTLGERNLNHEVRAVLSSSTMPRPSSRMTFDSQRPQVNLAETHNVQLTAIDPQSDCLYVLLMRDCLTTIVNVLKDWNAGDYRLNGGPKPNTLVCAQYDADDLWYRAWITSVTDRDVTVYFVDFGNEEVLSHDRLSECPVVLQSIPWQSIKIQLAKITLTEDERCALLREFETTRLQMRIIEEKQNVYHVDLEVNGKPLVNHVLNLRQTKPITVAQPVVKPPRSRDETPAVEHRQRVDVGVSQQILNSVQPVVDFAKAAVQSTSSSQVLPAVTAAADSSVNTTLNENLAALLAEQREQTRLLQRMMAAINVTNALLTQLVQR